ncbi:MAG: Fic family protein [candidate division Zixibacteria bacterium]|nr:Fic family protein [candidate division Zixibacteria bacterium]
MKRKQTGQYTTISTVGDEICRGFVPYPLPPKPAIQMSGRLQDIHDQALLALGRLDSVTMLLPDTFLFLYMYIRKEAVLSSQIEGTQSSLSELLLFEDEQRPQIPQDEIKDILNYVSAIEYGLERIQKGFPLSLRLIREIHSVLLRKGRGSEKNPGEFRTSQNWISGSRPGNAIFVPPPPEKVLECMGSLELFMHDRSSNIQALVKIAMIHAQFETIHPFLDGNGRVGRLLITLLLCSEGMLKQPLLYPSLYMKSHRQEYYDLLQAIRNEGDWEKWILFFLTGISETATQAVETVQRLVTLFKNDHEKIQATGRTAGSALRVHEVLQKNPIMAISRIAKTTALSIPTVTTALNTLVEMGIVIETTKRKRARRFAYNEYLKILNEGTEIIADSK